MEKLFFVNVTPITFFFIILTCSCIIGYFHNCHAYQISRWSSYAWHSIAYARPVLKLGLQWHIGDGKSVRITEDPWLPRSSSFRSLSAQNNLDSNERVSVLINEATHSWNTEAIHGLFLEWEAGIICSISLPPRPKPDQLFWNNTKSRIFIVKSAYFLQMRDWAAAKDGESSMVGKDRKFWKFLWSMSILQKVKSLLWRASLGILLTNELLWRRHMNQDSTCTGCLLELNP